MRSLFSIGPCFFAIFISSAVVIMIFCSGVTSDYSRLLLLLPREKLIVTNGVGWAGVIQQSLPASV
jgi:hypothetical protein